MKSCITTAHLYGVGGGAKAVFWIARGLVPHGPVTVFTRTAIPETVIQEMPKGIMYAQWYDGCSAGYDLHANVDHFHYERPLAKRNVAHIFHPHRRNRPPDGFELWANSAYTQEHILKEWGKESLRYFMPVDGDMFVGNKQKRILHVSRFAAPNQYADKGHRQMIHAFGTMRLDDWEFVLAGSVDPDQAGYFSSLMADAVGTSIKFAPSLPRLELVKLYASSAIYWHATGIGMPDVPGAQEHLGITTIEAMAAGCVPVVLGTGGQREIVTDKVNGVLVDDVRGLVGTTTALAKDLSSWSLLHQQAIRAGQAWSETDWFYEQFEGLLLDGVDMDMPKAKSPTLAYGLDDVDIIIPIYNSTMIHECLNRIPEGPHVIVVDNGSDVKTEHPRIDTYVRSEENLGYAGGNMRGLEYSARPIVLAMNDDVLAPGNEMWLQAMLLTISRPEVGVVGAKLTYPDDRLQHAGVLFDFHREDVGYHRWYGQEDRPEANTPREVPAVTGACLMAKRELFDMRPDLYPGGNYEDAHLCLNAWKEGYEVWYQPAAELVHIEAVTKRQTGLDYVIMNRRTFIEQWRAAFLDTDELRRCRESNG